MFLQSFDHWKEKKDERIKRELRKKKEEEQQKKENEQYEKKMKDKDRTSAFDGWYVASLVWSPKGRNLWMLSEALISY